MSKIYGEIKYSFDYKCTSDGTYKTLETGLHTDLDPWVIRENGDDQKKWVETLKVKSKEEPRGSKLGRKKNLTFLGWTKDTTRTNERYVVEYTKKSIGNIGYPDTSEKVVEYGVSIDDVYEIMRFSGVDTGERSWCYTDGTYQKKYTDSPVFWINEDIRFTNVNDNLKDEILDEKEVA